MTRLLTQGASHATKEKYFSHFLYMNRQKWKVALLALRPEAGSRNLGIEHLLNLVITTCVNEQEPHYYEDSFFVIRLE